MANNDSTTIMGWYIGQRVRCVRDNFVLFPDRPEVTRMVKHKKPKRGEIYTIRGFNQPADNWEINETLGLYLQEIVNPELRYQGGRKKELSFDVSGFEPVEMEKTDARRIA